MADPDADIPDEFRKKITVLAPASELTRMLEKRKKAKKGSTEKAELESKIRAYVKAKMSGRGKISGSRASTNTSIRAPPRLTCMASCASFIN